MLLHPTASMPDMREYATTVILPPHLVLNETSSAEERGRRVQEECSTLQRRMKLRRIQSETNIFKFSLADNNEAQIRPTKESLKKLGEFFQPVFFFVSSYTVSIDCSSLFYFISAVGSFFSPLLLLCAINISVTPVSFVYFSLNIVASHFT